jgi:hypothetical protein
MTPTDAHHTPAPDEIALPAFEDALWTALAAEHRSLHRRRPWAPRPAVRKVLSAAAAVAVVAGIGVVASSHGRGGTTIAAGPSSATTAPLSIEEQALAVLDPIARSSVVVTEEYEDDVLVSRSWHDSRTWGGRTVWYDAEGRPTGEIGLLDQPGEERPAQAVWIDHCRREWGQEPVTFVTSSSFDVVAGDLGRALFADGREVVDGVEMIRLRQTRPDPHDNTVTYLLDPDTLLPAAVRVAEHPERLDRLTVQPRTAETLAQLVTTAPATGYEEVPPPADDPSLSMFQGARSC